MNPETGTQFKSVHNILSEDGILKYNFMISLKDAAIAKIVSFLWLMESNQKAIVNLFHDEYELMYDEFFDKWKQIEYNVISQILSLPLPKPIIHQLTSRSSCFRKSIFNWIKYHDICIFQTNKYSKYFAVDLINNIKWTTRGRIDYEQTCKNILADEDIKITDDHKYKLACTYCLEDEIAIIGPAVVNPHYLDSIKIEDHPMAYFWTADNAALNKLKHDHYRCHRIDISVNVFILNILLTRPMGEFNEVPLRYMWNKLTENEKNKNVIGLMQLLRNQDLKFMLLSNLTYEQQTAVFKACSQIILSNILNDLLWRKYFMPTALHILDVVEPVSYVCILRMILLRKNTQMENEYMYNQYKYFFNVLWKSGSNHLRNIIFEQQDGLEKIANFVYLLSWKWDMDIIDLIFKDLSAEHKKYIILGNYGIKKCADFIVHDAWNFLELFINYTISSENDLRILKCRLVESEGNTIAKQFIDQSAWDNFEYFLNWVFCSDEEKKQFKKNNADYLMDVTLKFIFDHNKIDFFKIKTYLEWHHSEILVRTDNLKIEFPEIFFNALILHFIPDGKYELLDEFLNWYFLENQRQIEHFKSGLYKNNENIRRIIFDLMTVDNPFGMVDKFIFWSFSTSEQIEEFKSWIFHSHKDEHLFNQTTEFFQCKFIFKEKSHIIEHLNLSPNIYKKLCKIVKSQNDLLQWIGWFNLCEKKAAKFYRLYALIRDGSSSSDKNVVDNNDDDFDEWVFKTLFFNHK